MFCRLLRIVIALLLCFMSLSCFSIEIYKTIDKDGNVSFSSITPQHSKIIHTVSEEKLIKRISVINGAAEQNKKIQAITKKLTDSRIQRNKKREELANNYKDEITFNKNQRSEGLKNLDQEKSGLTSRLSNSQQLKKSISKILEQQE